jgi:omega-6 fatty acid desaturase (delta-12 desaturase)
MGLTLDRLFVQFHDMAHGSFFPSQKMNYWVGTAMGAVVYNPYGYWKFHHDYHHRHSNDLDFLQTSQTCPLTLAQYKKLSPTMQWVYTFFTSRPMMLLLTPSLVWAFFITRCRVRDLLYFVPATLFVVLTGRTMLITLGVMVGSTVGTYLFHMQHTFEDASRVHGKDYFENGLHGSSFLLIPSWMKFFTCGIEYHHIHHLNAKVPSYRIRQCHEDAGDLFNDIVVLPFSAGLDNLKFNTWDTVQKRFVHAYPGMK